MVECFSLAERSLPSPPSTALARASSALASPRSTTSLALEGISGGCVCVCVWHLQPPAPSRLHPLLPPPAAAAARVLGKPCLCCISPHPAAAPPSLLCLLAEMQILAPANIIIILLTASPQIVCSASPSSEPPSGPPSLHAAVFPLFVACSPVHPLLTALIC